MNCSGNVGSACSAGPKTWLRSSDDAEKIGYKWENIRFWNEYVDRHLTKFINDILKMRLRFFWMVKKKIISVEIIMETNEKINALREQMKSNNIHAYIIPSTDPHMSEHVASFWEARKWISGFTGSAGTVVVTLNEAGLWTDGRYFLQAEQQLAGSEIKLFKQGVPGVPEINDWLTQVLKKKQNVGIDAWVFAVSAHEKLKRSLKNHKLNLIGDYDLIKAIWNDRPAIPTKAAFILDNKYAGESIKDKIAEIRNSLIENEVNSHFIATLDDIAWILNLRGADVAFNPVTIAYLLIEEDRIILFIKKKKLTDEAKRTLTRNNIEIKGYKAVESYLKNNLRKSVCLIDPDRLNQKVLGWIKHNNTIVKRTNPSTYFKAVKNEVEIKNIKNAMRKDGIAMTKFLYWLDENIEGDNITEIVISEKLIELRSQQEGFMGESFSTIAGYRSNGAIIHYFATPLTNKTLEPSSFVLVDSGAQYLDGTTDLTRTIPLGPLTDEEKRDYTLVLKGHIQLALTKFPAGTRGNQLDTLARQPLLRQGLNYHHGTGHGVGFFLNVHEGPHSIHHDLNPNAIQEFAVTSNEPGLYRAGKYGIRIENLTITKTWKETEFGKFYEFDTVTVCPIDTRPIVTELLLEEEKQWLNSYHKKCFEIISPALEGDELEWLKNATKEI